MAFKPKTPAQTQARLKRPLILVNLDPANDGLPYEAHHVFIGLLVSAPPLLYNPIIMISYIIYYVTILYCSYNYDSNWLFSVC